MPTSPLFSSITLPTGNTPMQRMNSSISQPLKILSFHLCMMPSTLDGEIASAYGRFVVMAPNVSTIPAHAPITFISDPLRFCR